MTLGIPTQAEWVGKYARKAELHCHTGEQTAETHTSVGTPHRHDIEEKKSDTENTLHNYL